VFEYIEVFFNRRRRHSTLGMLSPAQFETMTKTTTEKITTTATAAAQKTRVHRSGELHQPRAAPRGRDPPQRLP
jgi:hypothetical protein